MKIYGIDAEWSKAADAMYNALRLKSHFKGGGNPIENGVVEKFWEQYQAEKFEPNAPTEEDKQLQFCSEITKKATCDKLETSKLCHWIVDGKYKNLCVPWFPLNDSRRTSYFTHTRS